MERKQSRGCQRIFTVAFDRLFQIRLGQVNANHCPEGVIAHNRSQKQEKGYCENTIKPATSFFFHDPKLAADMPWCNNGQLIFLIFNQSINGQPENNFIINFIIQSVVDQEVRETITIKKYSDQGKKTVFVVGVNFITLRDKP